MFQRRGGVQGCGFDSPGRLCQQRVRPPLTPDDTRSRSAATSRDVGASGEDETFGVQGANVTKDNFIHDLAAVSLGKRDCGAARGNTQHWRVIFGASAAVIVWPRWRENLMEAKRCPATPEDEEAVYGSSPRVNKALLFTHPPAAAALFSWLFIGAGGDRRSSRAERGGVALF